MRFLTQKIHFEHCQNGLVLLPAAVSLKYQFSLFAVYAVKPRHTGNSCRFFVQVLDQPVFYAERVPV